MTATITASVETAQEIVALVPVLRRFASRFAKSSSDIDDLVQEVVCRALSHVDSFAAGTSLRSWMFTIMRNTYCTQYARGVRESCGRLGDAATFDLPVPGSQDWALRAADLRVALSLLPSWERETLLLVADGISYEDAAIACKCRIGTIKSRVSRARSHLSEILGDPNASASVSIN